MVRVTGAVSAALRELLCKLCAASLYFVSKATLCIFVRTKNCGRPRIHDRLAIGHCHTAPIVDLPRAICLIRKLEILQLWSFRVGGDNHIRSLDRSTSGHASVNCVERT